MFGMKNVLFFVVNHVGMVVVSESDNTGTGDRQLLSKMWSIIRKSQEINEYSYGKLC